MVPNAMNEGLATARDVYEFFGCEPGTDDEVRHAVAGLQGDQPDEAQPTGDRVVLRDGDATLTVDEPVFAELYRAVFAGVGRDHTTLSQLGVSYLADAATKLGYADLVARIRQFQKAMSKGLATVKREGGGVWAPTPVSRVPARSTASEQEALDAEVETFMAPRKGTK